MAAARIAPMQVAAHAFGVSSQRDHLAKVYTLRFAADEERALDVQLTER